MANININSYNEILGAMIRKIIADTPANDLNKGSVILTLLEAAASNDYENNTSILNVLELLNIDALRNNDLDAYGSNLGLIRRTATKASGFVTISDSSIVKRSTTLYPIKPAPIIGTSTIYVNDAGTWNQTGTIYIGRGTPNFEGPLSYLSITNNGTFFTIQLASTLQKDHLLSDIVVDGQGTTNRLISAGTTVKIPANNISPEIKYTTLRDAILAAGEDNITGVPVTAINAGSVGNAGINTITFFNTPPFSTALVTNTNSFTNGTDTESDEVFKNRIKAYSSTLARGTKKSILASIDGVSDETEGKQVASAIITEPANIGEPSIVYVDDGSGFQPSFSGQSVDLLVASASGNEEFLQLANYPLPRPQVVNNADAPFLLTDGMVLKVLINAIEESIVFLASDFRSLSIASISEVVIAINNKATTFKARLTTNSTRILLYPVNYSVETIQVSSDGTSLDANVQFKFPVNEFSYIALYKNSTRLKEIQKSANITSNTFSAWNIIAAGNIIISVDGTPDQDRSFDTTDFGGKNFNATTIADWVTAFNNKFAGLTATSSANNELIVTSNKLGVTSVVDIVGGTYLQKMFSGKALTSIGQDSDFSLNRQNGNLQLKNPTAVGDIVSAGSSNTKGSIVSGSASAGNFNISVDTSNRPSEMVIVVDATRVQPRSINLAVGSTIILSNQGSNVMRVMASAASAFRNIQPNDFIYITNRGDTDSSGTGTWIDISSCGLFKVKDKGEHTTDNVDTYLEVINVNMVVGGPYSVQDTLDIQSFYSDKYPQLWKGTMATNPAAATIQSVIDSLNNNIKGASAVVFRTNYIKLTSTTENGGSIAVPISIGSASTQLFASAGVQKTGTTSHVANKVEDSDTITIFESTTPVNTNIWLDRYTSTDIKGSLTSAVEPSKDGSGTYSEILTNTSGSFSTNISYNDSVVITSGQNKQQIRDIRAVVDNNNLGTRNGIARTLLDYGASDEYQVVKNLEFSSEDNLVTIIDNDSIAKTIDMAFSRTGQINSGSQGIFSPTNLAFSAKDADNETGVDFGTLSVWGTLPTQSNTNFADYAVWFKARNWYVANSSTIILRCKEYGPIGDKVKFTVDYPNFPNTVSSCSHSVLPSSTLVTYTFGSGASQVMNIAPGDQFTIADLGSYAFRITFPLTATTNNITVGGVITISSSSGFNIANTGIFRVNAKNDTNRTIDIYNPSGVATIVGNPAIHSVSCSADVADSLNGTYFTLYAPNGNTVKFWYDNNNLGTIEPAIGTTTRSWKISPATGDSAITVATLTAAAILNDTAFATATNVSGTSNLITVTNTDNGPSLQGTNGSPSPLFTFTLVTIGIASTFETVSIISGIDSYPILDTATATIIAKINAGQILEAVEKTAGNIIKATREETLVSVNQLSYGHNSNPISGLNAIVSMHDSASHVLTFQNANPNFQLKTALLLNGISAVYATDTTVNVDLSVGEKFKLVPITINNIKHQLTQRALSQLNIISDIGISSAGKKIQLKSKLLGSNGAIEVVGGRANDASFKLIGDSQITIDNGVNYLELKIPASPNTLSPGQHVVLQNDNGVERLNRQVSTDSMNVVKINDSTAEYRYNNKTTNFNQYVKFVIADANGIDAVSYPTAGVVWRWTHSDDGAVVSLIDVGVGTVGVQPGAYNASGSLGAATNTVIVVNHIGSVGTSLDFNITMTGQPAQADYVAFRNALGITFAINFKIDGNVTIPTGSSYTTAANKIAIDILSTDTPNMIMSKIVSILLTNGISSSFIASVSAGATLSNVVAGNLVNPIGTLSGWSNTNKSANSGDSIVGGYPIVKVNAASKYFDVVNPHGKIMGSTAISTSSSVIISSTPIIEWKLAHSSRVKINSISVLSNVATATTDGPHKLNIGDTFSVINIAVGGEPNTPSTAVGTVNAVLGLNQFTYATDQANTATALQPGGFLLKTGKTRTRYKIESLGYNGLHRLKRVSGDSPKFISCGTAVDDVLSIGGSTLGTINSGSFSVLAVEEDAIIYKNVNAIEQLDTSVPFNNLQLSVNWVSNSNQITGIAGAFYNIVVGAWVKKQTDDDTQYRQVIALNAAAATATIITLGNTYSGVTSTSEGISLDQKNAIGTGVYLQDEADIKVYEGDSVSIEDSIFITSNNNANWFEISNSGTFTINAWGTDASDGKIFLRVTNLAGVSETNVLQNIVNTKFSITEASINKFTTIKQIHNIAIDEFDSNKRVVYLSPGNRAYKWGQSNSSSIVALGKMNYNKDIVTGVDGYLYYTGLLRKVQRIIDGFEPDAINYPGRKAVGSLIEVLPPLPRRVTIAVTVTTQDGVNLSEISDEITSSVINYIDSLGVGQDVIMSDIIVRVKNIDGVAAVTFITPVPSSERVAIGSDEKAFVEASDISIA